jgi:hypothetical protein
MGVRGFVAILGLCLMAGVGGDVPFAAPAVAASGPSSTYAAQRADEQAHATAEEQAAGLVASMPLPPGTTRLTAEPGDDGGTLAPMGEPGTPGRFTAATITWATVAEPLTTVLAYLDQHPPAGATYFDAFYPPAPLPPLVHIGLSFRGAPRGELSPLSGEVTLLAVAPSQTDLRISAVARWVGTPLAVPAGAKLLRVTFTGVRAAARRHTATRVVTASRKIEAIRAVLNRLPAERPHVHNILCPAPLGRLSLAFYPQQETAGEEPIAVAALADGGCGGATVTVEGVEGPPLSEDGASAAIAARTGLPGRAG